MQLSKLLLKHRILSRACVSSSTQSVGYNSQVVFTPMRYFAAKNKAENEGNPTKAGKVSEDEKISEEAKNQMADEAKEKNKKETKTAAQEQQDSSDVEDAASATQDSNAETEEAQKKIKELEEQLKARDEKLDDITKKLEKSVSSYKYQLAENDNTVKRYKEEVKKTKEYAISNFAKDMITVRDNLQLAVNHAKKFDVDSEQDLDKLKQEFKNLFNGVTMTSTVFDQTMKRFNVEEYNPKGEKFNPQFHEAVAMVDDPTKDPNVI